MGCISHKDAVQAVPEEEPSAPQERKSKRTTKNALEDIRDKYAIGEVLGAGSFGQVRTATLHKATSSSCCRAVKIVARNGLEDEWSNVAMFRKEVRLLQNINDPNIIKFYDFYEDPSFLYVVMEKCTGGEVFQKIRELRRFGEHDAAAIGKQMLSSVSYIHRHHIAHRDIKAENFLFSTKDMSSPLKMIDFGMATVVKPGEYLDALCGSPHYLSPELIGQKYDQTTDIWAFGVLMYLMLFGRYPHEGGRPEVIMWKILTNKISWTSDRVKLTKSCLHFLSHILEPNRHKRYTAEVALQHAWVKSSSDRQRSAAAPAQVPKEIREAAHSASKLRFTAPTQVATNFEEKLQQINRDYSHGKRLGRRIGNPSDAPATVSRHTTRLTTAPATPLVNPFMGSADSSTGFIGNKPGGGQSGGASVVPMAAGGESITQRRQSGHAAEKALRERICAPQMREQDTCTGIPRNRFQARAASTPHMAYIGDMPLETTISFAEKYRQLFEEGVRKDAAAEPTVVTLS